jgi:hypothetical protein
MCWKNYADIIGEAVFLPFNKLDRKIPWWKFEGNFDFE